MKTLLLLSVALLLTTAANSKSRINLTLLPDIICDRTETLGESNPDDAVGLAREVGRCQIQLPSARLVGYNGTRRDLMTPGGRLSKQVARKILGRCAKLFGYYDVHRVAFCYNGGPSRRYRRKSISWMYANYVNREYQFHLTRYEAS